MNRTKFAVALLAVVLCMSLGLQCSLAFADAVLLNGADFEVMTDGSGLEVGVAVYTDDAGEYLTAMPSGSTVKSAVSMKNTSSEAKDVSVVCALYNADNAMIDVSASTVALGSNKKATVQNTIDVPTDADDSWSIKTYVLETLDNMYSYCESFSFPSEPVAETPWSMDGGFALSSENVYDGYSSLKINGTAGECSQPMVLNKNSMYKMTFFGTGDADFGYGIYDGMGNPVVDEKDFEPSEDWKLNSLLFKSYDEENAVVKFGYKGQGLSYVDNVCVSDDIMINGGFEDSELGWVLDENCFEIAKTGVYEGKRALKITSKVAGARAYQETDVLAHCKGMISFKSKCSEDVYMKILDADSGELISKAGTTINSSSSWKTNNVYINTLGYDKVRVCFETKTSASKVSYIDDVKFTNLMYPDELVNADFENGTDGWVAGYASVEATTDEALSGEASACLTERRAMYGNLSQNITDILNKYGPGSYYVEGFVKPQLDHVESGYAVIRVLYTPKGGSETRATLNIRAPKSEWNKISGVVDLSWDTEISKATILFETSGGNDPTIISDLFIDDVSFFKMPD